LKSTSVRTGFLGLIISLKNFYSLCEMLFKDNICDYVLSYKLSQDHVEMFFALIRRMNGYTNNPTTIQFKSAYKKLLLNNINISVSESANCKPQDDTLLMTNESDISSVDNSIKQANNESDEVSCTKVLKKKRIRAPRRSKSFISSIEIDKYLHSNVIITEHDYCRHDSWVQSEYQDHVIKHTCGAVLHSIIKKVNCEKCIKMLKHQGSTKSKLTVLKNWGGLQFASDDVYFICLSAEKIIRKNKASLLSKNIYQRLVTETLKIIPSSVLDDNEHFFEQVFLIIGKY